MASSILRAFILVSFCKYCFCEIPTEPPVELRWDFNDCGQSGRFGPTEEMCDDTYKGTSLEGDIKVKFGVQTWTVPVSGLYLVTARGPSGAPIAGRQPGKGADLTGEFHMTEGQRMKILVGQQSDFPGVEDVGKSIGGSGGTFIVRESDDYLLMVAGGGSSGAGTKWNDWSITADASLERKGRNASKIGELSGFGGEERMGGYRGVLVENDNSASGGGAGYDGDGEKAMVKSGVNSARQPRAAEAFTSPGVSDRAPGVGGFFMYIGDDGIPVENNGGFGGGGAGSQKGGCGGGGGYSGGGGGPSNGWGGGGGSINNGGRPKTVVSNLGKGTVIISFIGHQCCGPVVVYIAMTFIAGVLFTIIIGFMVYKIFQAINSYDADGTKACVKCWSVLGRKKKNADQKTLNQPEENQSNT